MSNAFSGTWLYHHVICRVGTLRPWLRATFCWLVIGFHIPMLVVATAEAGTLVFPQLLAGPDLSSTLVLMNPSAEDEAGTIELFDPQGVPLELLIDGIRRSVFDYTVVAGGFVTVELSGEDVLETGYALVHSSGQGGVLVGTLRIRIGEDELLLLDAPARGQGQLYLESNDAIRTGLALVNLSQDQSSLKLEILGRNGQVSTQQTLLLAAGQQRVGFVDELIEGLNPPVEGILRITATGVFSLLAIRQDSTGGLTLLPGHSDTHPPLSLPGPDFFSGDLAWAHVRDQLAWGPRPTGSGELLASGDEIQSKLELLGWSVKQDLHTLDLGTLRVPVRNLVARLGQGPVVILGAHYDSRIRADRDTDPDRRGEAVPGANDGGSGTAVLLELARVISDHYLPSNEIRLVFFDAEDNGGIEPWSELSESLQGGWVIGSSLYAQGLDLEQEDIQFMILVDMVGDMDQRLPQELFSRSSAPELVDEIWAIADGLGFGEFFLAQPGFAILDDHRPFIERGIPAVDIIDFDYPFWHTTQDTLDKVSAESLERVGRVLQTFLMQSGVIARKLE